MRSCALATASSPLACDVRLSSFFFFSSRRRHTRLVNDWSSDVCSSDLGDEVLTPAFSFVASASTIVMAGATPVFVDIDPATYTLDVRAAERALTPRTRAIVPVHLYGHPAPMDAIVAFAGRHGLVVLEDAAQAIGATWAGRPVGNWGDAACVSFYPTRSEEHTSELQSLTNLVCRLLLDKKN